MSIGVVVVALGVAAAVVGVEAGWTTAADKRPSATPSLAPTPASTRSLTLLHTIELPKSFDDFTRMPNDDSGAKLRRDARQGKHFGPEFEKAKVGVYRRRGVSLPELLVFGFSAKADPLMADAFGRSPLRGRLTIFPRQRHEHQELPNRTSRRCPALR